MDNGSFRACFPGRLPCLVLAEPGPTTYRKRRLSFVFRDDVLMRVLIRHQLTVILALGLLVSVQSIAQETPTGAL